MNLPTEFEKRMIEMLGDEQNDFFAYYNAPRRPGLRTNLLKKGYQEFEKSGMFGIKEIPWAPHGFYYDPGTRPGKHPFHEAGVYYMQEPSAMAVAALSGVKPGMRVLDLCAAPGGKSTQLASMMQSQGILFSNEIHPVRAKILSQNIERMGVTNAIVTNETPEKMAERFPLYYDTVVVDAPCSGEGMFRKEEEAIPNWSPANVELCAERQKGILDCAARMTAPGGTLVYSTCTFAPQENEWNVALFLTRHPDFELIDLPEKLGREFMDKSGLMPGVPRYAEGTGVSDDILSSLKGCIRLWPHKLEGEGHFAAVFRRIGSEYARRVQLPAPLKDKEALKLWKEFVGSTLTEEGARKLATGAAADSSGLLLFGKELYRTPCGIDMKGLKVLRPGLHLGTLKKNRFEPSHALALALSEDDVKCCVATAEGNEEIPGNSAAVSAYLRGESLMIQNCSSVKGDKGWCLVTVSGFSMGWGKLSGGQVKNHYPKGLRRPY